MPRPQFYLTKRRDSALLPTGRRLLDLRPRTWPVADRRIKRRANNSYIEPLVWLCQASHMLQVCEGRYPCKCPLESRDQPQFGGSGWRKCSGWSEQLDVQVVIQQYSNFRQAMRILIQDIYGWEMHKNV